MRHSFLQISFIGYGHKLGDVKSFEMAWALLLRDPRRMTACEPLTSRFFIDPLYSSAGGSPEAVSTLNSQGFSSK